MFVGSLICFVSQQSQVDYSLSKTQDVEKNMFIFALCRIVAVAAVGAPILLALFVWRTQRGTIVTFARYCNNSNSIGHLLELFKRVKKLKIPFPYLMATTR